MLDIVHVFGSIWKNETGQDVVEYALLVAFVSLAVVALILSGSTTVNGIWSSTNVHLAQANASISGS